MNVIADEFQPGAPKFLFQHPYVKTFDVVSRNIAAANKPEHIFSNRFESRLMRDPLTCDAMDSRSFFWNSDTGLNFFSEADRLSVWRNLKHSNFNNSVNLSNRTPCFQINYYNRPGDF